MFDNLICHNFREGKEKIGREREKKEKKENQEGNRVIEEDGKGGREGMQI